MDFNLDEEFDENIDIAVRDGYCVEMCCESDVYAFVLGDRQTGTR